MLNTVILIGNLGRDPEIKMTQDSRQIAHLSLATSSSWRDEKGEWHTRTCWHKIVVFPESIVRWIIKNKLKKGNRVWVEGSLTYNAWQDRWGYRHRTSSILVSDYYGRMADLTLKNSAAAPSSENCEFEEGPHDLEQEEDSPVHSREQAFELPDAPFQINQQNNGEPKNEELNEYLNEQSPE